MRIANAPSRFVSLRLAHEHERQASTRSERNCFHEKRLAFANGLRVFGPRWVPFPTERKAPDRDNSGARARYSKRPVFSVIFRVFALDLILHR